MYAYIELVNRYEKGDMSSSSPGYSPTRRLRLPRQRGTPTGRSSHRWVPQLDSTTRPTMHKVGTRQRSGSAAGAPPIVRNAEAWGWQLSARCRGTDTSVFFHPDGERGLRRRRRQQNAKRFCAQCPVVMQCLEYSLRFREPYGIWGGISEDERHKILEHTIANARNRRSSPNRELLDDQALQRVPMDKEAGDV